MKNRTIKETRDETIIRLCNDLISWQKVACPDRGTFFLVLMRVLAAHLSLLPEELADESLTSLLACVMEDRVALSEHLKKSQNGKT